MEVSLLDEKCWLLLLLCARQSTVRVVADMKFGSLVRGNL